MPAPDQWKSQSASPVLKEMFKALPTPDLMDLERRVADLEDRARREDQTDAAKDRLRTMGLVFPRTKAART